MPPITIGFLGLGIMGTAMARNLLKAKGDQFTDVIIWNRTISKCAELEAEGCKVASSPSEVVQRCDITIGMLADPTAATSAVFDEGGVLEGISAGKGYVDMSTVDEQTSTSIAKAITEKGGRFLEAPVSGSKGPAIAGQLVILSAGDRALYDECEGAFGLMGKKAFFLGEVGAGARMKLVVNMIMGSMMGAFTEGMCLADKGGLKQKDLLDVLSLGAIANPMFSLKGPSIIERNYAPAFPLKHQQKDMRLAIALGDQLGQPLPIAAAANELYKVARANHGDDDFSAVYAATSGEK